MLSTLAACAGLGAGLIAGAAFLLLVLPRMLSADRAQTEDPRVRPNPFIKN